MDGLMYREMIAITMPNSQTNVESWTTWILKRNQCAVYAKVIVIWQSELIHTEFLITTLKAYQIASNIFLFNVVDFCVRRTRSAVCAHLQDRESCLTATESRREVLQGGEIYGSECAWCMNGPCTSNIADFRCGPKSWLQAQGIKDIETCLINR